MAEYRQGHFAGAVEWAARSLEGPRYIYAQAEAYCVLAMAQFRLKEFDKARAALTQVDTLGLKRSPTTDSDDLGNDWQSWIFVQILRDEARALIQLAPAGGDDKP